MPKSILLDALMTSVLPCLFHIVGFGIKDRNVPADIAYFIPLHVDLALKRVYAFTIISFVLVFQNTICFCCKWTNFSFYMNEFEGGLFL